jgi:hypothetical protein
MISFSIKSGRKESVFLPVRPLETDSDTHGQHAISTSTSSATFYAAKICSG